MEFRVEKAGIIHAGVGKASFSEEQILQDVKAFVDGGESQADGREGHIAKTKRHGESRGVLRFVAAGLTAGRGARFLARGGDAR